LENLQSFFFLIFQINYHTHTHTHTCSSHVKYHYTVLTPKKWNIKLKEEEKYLKTDKSDKSDKSIEFVDVKSLNASVCTKK